MNIKIEFYDSSQRINWDEFIRQSKNGTFLLMRNYMEYHNDRFHDCSLLIRDEKGKIVALLPANKDNNILVSHGGLTYGGFITDSYMTTPKMVQVFDDTITFLQQNSFVKFIYKTIPYIYHIFPAEEDRYALYLCNAYLIRRDVLTVIDKSARLPFQERRRRSIAKARKNNLFVKQCECFETFWQILLENLDLRYKVKPVHSLEEIELLYSRFPDNIKLFSCFQGPVMLAGVVIYESKKVAHVQYIASNGQGKKVGALDLIFNYLLTDYYYNKPFFDFGISNENDGRYLNKGLIDQKEGFGARAVVHDQYEIPITNWEQGQLRRAME